MAYSLPMGSHEISLDQAIKMTTLYREMKSTVIAPSYQNTGILCFSETFNKAAIDKLMQTPNAAALRIYYGMSEDLKLHAILVAVNEDGQDILPSADSTITSEEDGIIVEEGQKCPPICPDPPSPLNP
jgi:hypothetical protein